MPIKTEIIRFMNIYDFSDYKAFINKKIASLPKKGFGQFRKLAQHLNISPVIVSQVFKGDRELTLEQAHGSTEFFGLNTMERDYFLLLVQRNRAGNYKLKEVFEEQLKVIVEKSREVKSRVTANELSEEDKALYYSHWYYSATRLAANQSHLNSEEELAEYFNLPLKKMREIVDFLISKDICKFENNKFKTSINKTHIPKESPFVNRHHQNWRLKGFERMNHNSENDLFYTVPISASHKTKEKFKTELLKLIQELDKEVIKAKNETLFCLNLDLFSF